MEGEKGAADLYEVPLTFLTYEARNLLSCLLNTSKVLLSEESPNGIPRDWRGLATLVNIPSDISHSFEEKDKTRKVLEYWVQLGDGTANVGQLLEYVERMDRFDVFDDFMDLYVGRRLLLTQLASPSPHLQDEAAQGQLMWYHHQDQNDNILTYDDLRHGSPQTYDAFVLYAKEDEGFALELINKMTNRGYKLCSEKDLLPHLIYTLYMTVSRLISSKYCHWVLPIYSPDFLNCPANNFYTSYTQELAMKSKRGRHIPCVYRQCTLPSPINNSLMLYFNSNMYNFWERLEQSLDVQLGDSSERLSDPTDTFSSLNIEELRSSVEILPRSDSPNGWKKMRKRLRKWFAHAKFWQRNRAIVSY